LTVKRDEEDDQGDADTQKREDKEETAEEPTVSDLNEDFQIQPPPSTKHKITSEVPGILNDTKIVRKESGTATNCFSKITGVLDQ
jgi:hypothetical protein